MEYRRILAAFAGLALPGVANTHIRLHTDGTLAGLGHPFSGLAHILAMVAVGFWAATLGGRARWIVRLAFVTVMAIGGVTGIYGVPLPMVEMGTALTVAVLGLLVAFEVKVPAPVAAAIVGVCALFHGHAHGSELPAISHATGYVMSFLAATIILHAGGIA
ncbi:MULTISPECIES: HupE/UreJ family protein [Rhizobium]|uniref:Hydrogenase/urease accesory protein HupE n=1 Tax=Rhizobium gallicum bv. gallicum R602sp TaxID=1041138 RepID=A0A0B4XAQ6_9HYPH|nr:MULTISPECIES: HupE/UreJ family protein [Rhizobium]AJD43617.1 hydrogenase/urease accesory protein HupE [Rhizobium gallicum bv. gallicum R602sp]TDW34113.1 urease accessory protein [Rhizobium azibense]